MTELIVALDGPSNAGAIRDLAYRLKDEAGVRWIKVGPLSRALGFHALSRPSAGRFNIFYDEKLADHGPYVCTEFVKRLASLGVAAVSTSTDAATEAALRGAEGMLLRVWRHVAPTHRDIPYYRAVDLIERAVRQGAHGVICGAWFISAIPSDEFPAALGSLDIISPGIRIGDDGDDHVKTTMPSLCNFLGVTHAVVGRPIYNASDPVAAAKRYMEALT